MFLFKASSSLKHPLNKCSKAPSHSRVIVIKLLSAIKSCRATFAFACTLKGPVISTKTLIRNHERGRNAHGGDKLQRKQQLCVCQMRCWTTTKPGSPAVWESWETVFPESVHQTAESARRCVNAGLSFFMEPLKIRPQTCLFYCRTGQKVSF